eukprot:4268830-Karenia_brevis.AAC.1
MALGISIRQNLHVVTRLISLLPMTNLPNNVEWRLLLKGWAGKKGTISHQWVDIAKIEAPRRDEDVKLFFQDAKMSEYGFEKDKIKEKFANFVSRHAGDDMWCS